MLDQDKADLLEQYRRRVHDWVRAYAFAHDTLNKEVNRRRWLTKLWNRFSLFITFGSLLVGSQLPMLISNPVLFQYVQLLLILGGIITWGKFLWTLTDGPDLPDTLPLADMVETADTGDLKSSAFRRTGSNPVIGTKV